MPFGNALKVIRDNETRATFIGLPVRRYRWFAFVVSAAFVGLAGTATALLRTLLNRTGFAGGFHS